MLNFLEEQQNIILGHLKAALVLPARNYENCQEISEPNWYARGEIERLAASMGCGSSKTVQVGRETSQKDAIDIKKQWLPSNDSSPNSKIECDETRVINDGKTAPDASEEPSFIIGDLVHLRGHVGAVRFVGETKLGEGEWIGVEMHHQLDQGNDGSYDGVRYFECKPKCGVFARASMLFLHKVRRDVTAKTDLLALSTVALVQLRMKRILEEVRRRKLQLHSDVDKMVDKHVQSTPKEETESVQRLSHYLTEPIDGQRNKAFAIYRWITRNIRYHSDGYVGQRHSHEEHSPERVLGSRMAFCEGFAALFEQLCKASNIPARTVRGYAKCYAYRPKGKLPEANHSWNVIRVGGKWFVCDTMWGAGEFDEDVMFHRGPNVHRFMVPPEIAALSHFPLDQKWLFLDEPFTKEEFENCAVPSGFLVEAGVMAKSHKHCSYTVDSDHLRMSFHSKTSGCLKGLLRDISGEPASARDLVRVTTQKDSDEVFVQFPTRGEYLLDIFVLAHGKWELGLQYLIYATGGVGERRGGFPRISNNFTSLGFALDEPLENIDTMDGRAAVSLICQKKRFATVVGKVMKISKSDREGSTKEEKMGRNLCYTEKRNQGYLVQVHLPERGEYRLDLFAKYIEPRKPQEYLCSYFINASRGVTPLAGFPITSLRFKLWELDYIDRRENIFTEEGRFTVGFENPRGIILSGHLKRGDEDLSGMCLVKHAAGKTSIAVQVPTAGLFTLNIFGRKTPGAKAEFLCSYTVKALKGVGENPGFPELSDTFRDWGMELVDQPENITSESGRGSVRLKTPGSILLQAVLQQDNQDLPEDLCFTEKDGSESRISAHLPSPGFYRLNVFGRQGLGADGQYLCSYTMMAMSGFGGHAGFPRITEEFRTWGLRLESHKENIVVYDGKVAITLINEFGVPLFPRLTDEEGTEQDSSCLTREKNEEREIFYCELPSKGNYLFELLGANDSSAETRALLCTYKIYY